MLSFMSLIICGICCVAGAAAFGTGLAAGAFSSFSRNHDLRHTGREKEKKVRNKVVYTYAER